MTESTGPAEPGSPEPSPDAPPAPTSAGSVPPASPAPSAPWAPTPPPVPPGASSPEYGQPPYGQAPGYGQPPYGQAPGYGVLVPPAYPVGVNPVARTPLDKLAIWALVLTLLLITSPIGLVLGIISITRTGRGRRGGRAIAVTSTVLASLILLTVGGGVAAAVYLANRDAPRDAAGKVTETADISVAKLREGDCFKQDLSDGAEKVYSITATPCASPHSSQVVKIFDLPPAKYPGRKALTDQALQQCDALKPASLLTPAAATRKDLSVAVFVPESATEWKNSRTVTCILVSTATLSESLLK